MIEEPLKANQLTADVVLLNILGFMENIDLTNLKKGKNGPVLVEKTITGRIDKIEQGDTTYLIQYFVSSTAEPTKINNLPINAFKTKYIRYKAMRTPYIQK